MLAVKSEEHLKAASLDFKWTLIGSGGLIAPCHLLLALCYVWLAAANDG